MIDFACEHCGHSLHVPDSAAGKKGKCKKCQKPVTIPEPSDVEFDEDDEVMDADLAEVEEEGYQELPPPKKRGLVKPQKNKRKENDSNDDSRGEWYWKPVIGMVVIGFLTLIVLLGVYGATPYDKGYEYGKFAQSHGRDAAMQKYSGKPGFSYKPGTAAWREFARGALDAESGAPKRSELQKRDGGITLPKDDDPIANQQKKDSPDLTRVEAGTENRLPQIEDINEVIHRTKHALEVAPFVVRREQQNDWMKIKISADAGRILESTLTTSPPSATLQFTVKLQFAESNGFASRESAENVDSYRAPTQGTPSRFVYHHQDGQWHLDKAEFQIYDFGWKWIQPEGFLADPVERVAREAAGKPLLKAIAQPAPPAIKANAKVSGEISATTKDDVKKGKEDEPTADEEKRMKVIFKEWAALRGEALKKAAKMSKSDGDEYINRIDKGLVKSLTGKYNITNEELDRIEDYGAKSNWWQKD